MLFPQDGVKTVYTYNDAGFHVRTTDYEPPGEIRFDIHYEFDAQRVVGWKVFDGKGNTIKRFDVDYDSQGLEIETRQYGDQGELERRERYAYDDNNQRIEDQHFDAAGTLRSRKVYTSNGDAVNANYYDAVGNPIKGPAA